MKLALRFMITFSLICSAPAGATTSGLSGQLLNIGCAQESGLRSIDGNAATSVTFVNQSGTPVRTYWLNYDGKRVFYAEIAPGQQYTQQTYVTHPWVIADNRSGNCMALFQPAPIPSTAIIR